MKCIFTTNHKSFEVIPIIHFKRNFISLKKQGRIYGNTVAAGLAGAVIQSLIAILEIFVTDGRTDGPTRQGVESRIRD